MNDIYASCKIVQDSKSILKNSGANRSEPECSVWVDRGPGGCAGTPAPGAKIQKNEVVRITGEEDVSRFGKGDRFGESPDPYHWKDNRKILEQLKILTDSNKRRIEKRAGQSCLSMAEVCAVAALAFAHKDFTYESCCVCFYSYSHSLGGGCGCPVLYCTWCTCVPDIRYARPW